MKINIIKTVLIFKICKTVIVKVFIKNGIDFNIPVVDRLDGRHSTNCFFFLSFENVESCRADVRKLEPPVENLLVDLPRLGLDQAGDQGEVGLEVVQVLPGLRHDSLLQPTEIVVEVG